MSTLADRVRGILQSPRRNGVVEPAPVLPSDSVRPDLERALGGRWHHEAGASCFIVDSRLERQARHGLDTVGGVAARLTASSGQAPLLAGFPVRPPFLFFDLETTGLSGGAGSYAFLIGFGWFDDDAFVTRQFVVARIVDERAVLRAVADELARAGALVSFNGRSFDAPLLETRFLFHRLGWAGGGLAHLDMLPVARRFWKPSTDPSASMRIGADSVGSGCSLGALERQLLDCHRTGDVPGFEIPRRYFQFVRTGDPRGLAAVFHHNRLDLLSLAALTARALHLVGAGPAAARDPREALALGWLYMRAGLDELGRESYRRAADPACPTAIQVDALRALALAARRARTHDAAADYWRRLIGVPGCPSGIVREASEALAIHHEHRVRDLVTAKRFAQQSVECGTSPGSSQKGEYRLSRIERKLQKSDVCRLKFEVEV